MDHTTTAMAESGRTVATASEALRQSTVPVVSALRAVEAAPTQTTGALAAVQAIGETNTMRQALEAINVASSATLAFQLSVISAPTTEADIDRSCEVI